jgi:hypothetical protein
MENAAEESTSPTSKDDTHVSKKAKTDTSSTAATASTASKSKKGGNPIVYFDIEIGGQAAGKITMELYRDVVPRT